LWIFAYMWSVALSSIIARLVQREGFADVSFRFGGRRTLTWPCIVLHAAYNSVIQSAFWPAAPGTEAFTWVGMEAGILVAVVLVLLALALCRGRWTLLREPGRPMSAPAAV
jgi:hypothetical protein